MSTLIKIRVLNFSGIKVNIAYNFKSNHHKKYSSIIITYPVR